jgi:hypothetical protein
VQACTASPTEISFNHSEDPAELFRAEAQFLSHEELLAELQILHQDIIDDDKGEISRDIRIPDSDAALSYAKLRALFPRKTQDELAKTTPSALVSEPALQQLLGITQCVRAATADELSEGIKKYVGSKDKLIGSVEPGHGTSSRFELWPLVKVVRIYTKASALETGVVLVDLVSFS